jgi:hypothetical protein
LSLVRTVSAVLVPDERGEETALRKEAVVLLGVEQVSRNSFNTCSIRIVGLSVGGRDRRGLVGDDVRDFLDKGDGVYLEEGSL